MPSDDYSSSVGGGLKLKGGASIAKPSGIKKKKKKKTVASQAASDSKTEALQKALGEEDAAQKKSGKGDGDAEEELSEEQLRDLEYRSGDGKTASERAHEEMRRRRVCSQSALPCFFRFLFPAGDMRDMALVIRNMFTDFFWLQLQDRLAKEGVKTHKQRVEELNKYLSNLSEHHDMPRIGPG